MRPLRVLAVVATVLFALVGCGQSDKLSTGFVPPSPPMSLSAAPATDGPVTFFYGLGLHLGSTWQPTPQGLEPEVRAVIVDAKCNTTPRVYCPGFVVAPIEQDPSVRSDTRLDNGCWFNGVVDDRYFAFPQRLGSVTISGQPAEYFKYFECSRETGKKKGEGALYMWRVVTKGVIVYDLKSPGSQEPLPGLEALLAGAAWQS